MASTPFQDLNDYIALPRIGALALSHEGDRAAVTVATIGKDATSYDNALWEVPTDGAAPRRLTRSSKGESGAAYLPGGDLLFVSARPDGQASEDDVAQLWLLPAAGGEARPVTALAGGVSGIVAVASEARTVIVAAALMPSAVTLEDDARIRAERKKRKVSAILHSGYPVRYWDHDLGPAEAHLLAIDLTGIGAESAVVAPPAKDEDAADADPAPYPAHLPRPVDLTPQPGKTIDMAHAVVTPDGATVIVAESVPDSRSYRARLVRIEVADGTRTVIAEEPGVDLGDPALSHDGTRLAYVREVWPTPAGPTPHEIWTSALDGSDPRRIAAEWDRWPSSLAFSADDSALIATADHDGNGPVFRVPLDGGQVAQVTTDAAAYSSLAIDPATGDAIALRATMAEPLQPVRIGADGTVTALATPAPSPVTEGSVEEVRTTAEDGTEVRGWLFLPEGASAEHPAPLLLWIHGGPLNSWNQWSWRWNPHLATARGYAVLMPDPALSTGYGLDFIARGWNSWGATPYTDLLAITDATAARADVDETRTAAMGGSFGGYMANWVAGHTDRFRAIVTHASLWALDQFGPTTDMSGYWQSIFTREAMEEHSPHRHLDSIVTPMLVIHGDKDYRVPIGEGLRLWSELQGAHTGAPEEFAHRYLYFPDENHWILKPQHAAVWYETVFAFLAEHVLDEERELPESLG